MDDPATSTEVTVAPDEVEAAVARVCADWGVPREAVDVDILSGPADPAEAMLAGTVRLRISRRDFGDQTETEAADAQADAAQQDDSDLDRAQRTLAELMSLMHVQADVHASWGREDEGVRPIVLDLRGEDLGMLIGRRGETLAALQYITRLILSRQTGGNVDLVVDVQGTKRKREEQLRRLARRVADQAIERQRTMTLEPMPPHERRIIHLELRDYPGVRTESVGDGHHRKVTIIPEPV
jgi:spoIIIJ-associated protein